MPDVLMPCNLLTSAAQIQLGSDLVTNNQKKVPTYLALQVRHSLNVLTCLLHNRNWCHRSIVNWLMQALKVSFLYDNNSTSVGGLFCTKWSWCCQQLWMCRKRVFCTKMKNIRRYATCNFSLQYCIAGACAERPSMLVQAPKKPSCKIIMSFSHEWC